MREASLIVFGRYPPPIDGQSLATRRFVSLIEDEFELIRLDASIPARSSSIAKFRHYLQIGWKLRRTVRNDPDAFIIWQSISGQPSGHVRDLIAVVPHINHRKTVAVVHWGSFGVLLDSPVFRRTARFLEKAVCRFVFTTDRLSAACDEWLPAEKRVVIPNTIDETTVCAESEVSAKRESGVMDPFRILYLSNMIQEKGYLDVLRAVALLREADHKVVVDFVGAWSDDEDARDFERTVRDYGLDQSVTHHGAVSDRESIKSFHLNSHVFILPSYHIAEAQPLSIIEALSAGSPVIVTEHGGIPDLVRDGEEALFVPPRSPEAIRDAVVRIADPDTWIEMSLRARVRFLENYHPDIVRKQWIELLDDLYEAGGCVD